MTAEPIFTDMKEWEEERRKLRIQRMIKCYEDAGAIQDAWRRSGVAPNVASMASDFFIAESLERMLGVPTVKPLRHEIIKAVVDCSNANEDFNENLQRNLK